MKLLHYPLTSFLLNSSVFLSALFSNNLILFFPYCDRPSFTPIQYIRQVITLCFNLYVSRYQTRMVPCTKLQKPTDKSLCGGLHPATYSGGPGTGPDPDTGFSPWRVCLEFMVDKMALWLVLLQDLRCPSQSSLYDFSKLIQQKGAV
jgi:hypothetical protein